MCLGVPARVLSVDDGRAQLDFRGVHREADASMVSIRPGDYVIVYAGLIVQVLDPEEAEAQLRTLEELDRASGAA